MTKYSINVGGLSPEDKATIHRAANSGREVRIEAETELPASEASSSDAGSSVKKTEIRQTVHQYGENNYTFDEPVSGFHIGDVIKE